MTVCQGMCRDRSALADARQRDGQFAGPTPGRRNRGTDIWSVGGRCGRDKMPRRWVKVSRSALIHPRPMRRGERPEDIARLFRRYGATGTCFAQSVLRAPEHLNFLRGFDEELGVRISRP
jgi:hypothetical protein